MHKQRPAELTIAGLTPLTTIDFPDHLAAVVFCQGCPWRCRYCHNPQLLGRRGDSRLSWKEVMAFLQRRRGLLDAVVFSGGEPTLQASLLEAVRDVKALGYRVGLHTAGAYPLRLERLLPWLDWVGMDIKAPFDQYEQLTGVPRSGERALKSARVLLESGVAHEFRTTVDAPLAEGNALVLLGQRLAALGVKHYVLQECRSADGQGAPTPVPHSVIPEVGELFEHFDVRRAT